MFDRKIFRNLIDKIIEIGAGHEVEEIPYAMPNKPPAKLNRFKFHPSAQTALNTFVYLIESNPVLSKVFVNKQFNYGSISNTMTADILIMWLIEESKRYGTDNALDSLEIFVKQGYTPAHKYYAISGIKVEETISLTDDVAICPVEVIRDSTMKFRASPKEVPNPTSIGGTETSDERHPIAFFKRAVRLKTVVECPFHYHPRHDTTLDNLSSFLTLLDKATPMLFYQWIELDKHVPMHQHTLVDFIGNGSELNYKHLVTLDRSTWNDLKPTYDMFLSLNQHDRVLIASTLDRIKNSKARWKLIDRAIDLGVALESLLLKRGEDKAIKEKFAFRANLILERNTDRDNYTNSFFKALYSCRSNAVHDGVLEDSYDIGTYETLSAEQLIEKGTSYAMQITKNMILHGGLPDWKSLISEFESTV